MENNKFTNSIKRIIVICVVIALLSGIGVAAYFLRDDKNKDTKSKDITETINESVENYKDLIDLFEKNKEINSDYMGQIYFESGLIDLPFVQGVSNNTYLRTDWTTMNYDEGGSVFMDAANVFNDQNIILYGHNYDADYDPTLSQKFTPLRQLENKEVYEKNKIIYLFTGDKLREYEIVSIFRVKIVEEDDIQYIDSNEPIYVIKNYSDEEFADYVNKVKQKEFFDTKADISYQDKFLTLQTCIDDSVDKFIVLAKLLSITEIQ